MKEKSVQKQLGKDPAQVRLRAKKVAAAMLAGKTRKQALLEAGYSLWAAKNGLPIVSTPLFKKTYHEILEAAGVTDEACAVVIKDAMAAEKMEICGKEIEKVPDHPVRLKAIGERHRLLGMYIDKMEVTVKPLVKLDDEDE